MLAQKRILICPLNWGLGHVTRCIPIIRLLIKNKATVIIAADGRPLALLKQEFPDLEFITLEGYNFKYPENGSMVLNMLLSIPSILRGIWKEHKALKSIIAEKKLDIVISDNRFGLWSKEVKSIFITHQLMIKSPFAEGLLRKLNHYFIKKYDECWVPDYEGVNNLSGDLAHKHSLPPSSFFIGPLSRFEPVKTKQENYRYEVMAIISGPESQRSIFEKIVVQQLKGSNLKAIVVCGKTEESQSKKTIGNVEVISHLSSTEMRETILQSRTIVARSGYSTIMDMAVLEKKCVLIPTPGQTEQEYLAKKLMQENVAYSQSQRDFELKTALQKSEKYLGIKRVPQTDVLITRIKCFL